MAIATVQYAIPVPYLPEWITPEALATALAGVAAVLAALFVAYRQQQIKRQELRLSLLAERRSLIRKMRDLNTQMTSAKSLDDPVVDDFFHAVRDCRLLFDPHTAVAIEACFDQAWDIVAARQSMQLFREEAMGDDVRKEAEKFQRNMSKLLASLPDAIKLMEARTRVPEKI